MSSNKNNEAAALGTYWIHIAKKELKKEQPLQLPFTYTAEYFFFDCKDVDCEFKVPFLMLMVHWNSRQSLFSLPLSLNGYLTLLPLTTVRTSEQNP